MNRFLNRKKDYSDIKSRAPSQEYSEGWDRIFGKKKIDDRDSHACSFNRLTKEQIEDAIHQETSEGSDNPSDSRGA